MADAKLPANSGSLVPMLAAAFFAISRIVSVMALRIASAFSPPEKGSFAVSASMRANSACKFSRRAFSPLMTLRANSPISRMPFQTAKPMAKSKRETHRMARRAAMILRGILVCLAITSVGRRKSAAMGNAMRNGKSAGIQYRKTAKSAPMPIAVYNKMNKKRLYPSSGKNRINPPKKL